MFSMATLVSVGSFQQAFASVETDFKVLCPNTVGIGGPEKISILNGRNELGFQQIICPGTGHLPDSIPGKFTTNGPATSYNVQLSLTNTNNGHSSSQSFSGRLPGSCAIVQGTAVHCPPNVQVSLSLDGDELIMVITGPRF